MQRVVFLNRFATRAGLSCPNRTGRYSCYRAAFSEGVGYLLWGDTRRRALCHKFSIGVVAMNLKKLSDEFFVAGQIFPDDLSELWNEGFRTIINNRPDNEGNDQPDSIEIEASARAAGMDYYHLPFASGIVPEPVAREFSEKYPGMQKPVLAFCRSGARAEILWMNTD